eukprot:m.31756 g.31756  ORF g.31756 m.31756 type:complete len:480 (+) comp8346_c0_seq2:252-1691(+)
MENITGARYEGFVALESVSKPTAEQISNAIAMLEPKNAKATRRIHPLWARAIKDPLNILAQKERMIGQVRNAKTGISAKVFEILYTRITSVHQKDDNVYVVCRLADSHDQYCHKIKIPKGKSSSSFAASLHSATRSDQLEKIPEKIVEEKVTVPLRKPRHASTPMKEKRRLSGVFGFGDDSQLEISMLDLDDGIHEDEECDEEGVPKSWLTAELPKHVNKLFTGFKSDEKILEEEVIDKIDFNLSMERALKETSPTRSDSTRSACRLSDFGERLEDMTDFLKDDCSLCNKNKKSKWVRLENCGCYFHTDCMENYRSEGYNICPRCHKTIGETIYYLTHKGTHLLSDNELENPPMQNIKDKLAAEDMTNPVTLVVADDCLTIENVERDFSIWIQASLQDVLRIVRVDALWVLIEVDNKTDVSRLSANDSRTSRVSMYDGSILNIPAARRVVQAFLFPSEFEAIAFYDAMMKVVNLTPGFD